MSSIPVVLICTWHLSSQVPSWYSSLQLQIWCHWPLSLLWSLLSFYLLHHSMFPFHPHDFLIIPSDFYLHQLVLSCWLHSSTYSSTSLIFFLVLWWHVLWIRAGVTGSVHNTLFLYIYHHTSCMFSLTLTYSITSWIYQGLRLLALESLSLCCTIESMLLWNLRTYGICLDAWIPQWTTLKANLVQLSLCLSLPRPSITKGQSYLTRLSPI